MSIAAPIPAIRAATWCGWIRTGSDFPAFESAEPGRLELGAARFSLPDLEEARTTSWAHEQGRFSLFSGYLYNREELARELDAQDPGFSVRSPAAVLLAGYRRWGRDVFDRLDGVFAGVVWDQPDGTLWGGRDAMGLFPFYYSVAGEELVFSWEVEAVLRHPGVSRELHRPALAELLSGRVMEEGETFFEQVRRLPGGHGLKFTRGRLEIFRYWDPLPPGRKMNWVTPDELTQFPDLLRKAVACTMQFGPVGIFLSGGIDSVSIAATAADVASEHQWDAPRALSFILSEEEERIQRGVAETLRLPQSLARKEEYLNGRGFLRRVLDFAGISPSPPLALFASPFLDLQAQAKQQGRRAVLTGDGGDDWLTATPTYAADLIRSADLRGLVRLAQAEWRRYPNLRQSPSLLLKWILWRVGVRELGRDWIWRRAPRLALARRRQLAKRAIPSWIAPDPALRRVILERFESWATETAEDGFYVKDSRIALRDPLKLLSFEERFYRDTAAGIPTLHPYWHRPLVDFLLRTPPAWLNSGGWSKAPVRRALAERFPLLGFEGQKKMLFTSLGDEILRREAPGLWRQLGRASGMAEIGLVDLTCFHDILSPCMDSTDAAALHRLWCTASIETWIRARVRNCCV